jgi:hypothetical protein
MAQREGHIADASTVVHWKLDEAAHGAAAVDAMGTLNLNSAGSGTARPVPVTGQVGAAPDYRARGFGGNVQLSGPSTAGHRAAMVGNWLTMAWVYLAPSSDFTTPTIVSFQLFGETEDGNFLILLQVGGPTSALPGHFRVFWEYGAGIDMSQWTPSPVFSFNTPHHVAVRKVVGTSDTYCEVYVDGALVHSFTATSATGGTAVGMAWTLGGNSTNATSYWTGWIQDFIIYGEVKDAAFILEAYERGQYVIADPADETPPTVTVLSPEPGTPIGRNDEVVIRITDDVGLASAPLYAIYDIIGLWEVVHDGDDFSPPFGESKRIVIASGYEFVLKRAGGWPELPLTLRVKPVDTSGNKG